MFRTARVESVRERHGSEAAYKHIGVGFCVARFGKMGNAKASDRGTGDGTDSRAFSCPNPNPEQPFRGVERQVKTIRPMKKSAFSEQQPRCPPCPALEQPRCSKNKGAGPACCPFDPRTARRKTGPRLRHLPRETNRQLPTTRPDTHLGHFTLKTMNSTMKTIDKLMLLLAALFTLGCLTSCGGDAGNTWQRW